MKRTQSDENQKYEDVALKSVKRSIVITLIVCMLYNYQKYMSSFNHKHHVQSFVCLFALMTITIFSIESFAPQFSQNIMYGVGWAIGAALLNKIIDFK